MTYAPLGLGVKELQSVTSPAVKEMDDITTESAINGHSINNHVFAT